MREKIIVNASKKIFYDYTVKEKYECGIVLLPWEVKAIRNSGCSIMNSYVSIRHLELWLVGLHINIPFFLNSSNNLKSDRDRKLLLHKKELMYFLGILKMKGCTLVPSKVYWKKNFIKIEVCLGVGKKKYDKRISIKTREWNLDKQRMLKNV